MSAKARLQKMQAALQKDGAVDVKFYLAPNPESPSTEVATDVADFLEATRIKERVKPKGKLGDSTQQR